LGSRHLVPQIRILLRPLADMARLMGVALRFVMPSLVATAGTDALGYDHSALLQVDTAMASIQTASSLDDSDEYFKSTIQPQLGKASDFIMDKLQGPHKKTRRRENQTQTTGVVTVLGNIFDALTMFYESSAESIKNRWFNKKGENSEQHKWLGQHCAPVVIFVWWLMGILVMVIDQKLDFWSAVDMLTQQYSSVGYGSTSQDTMGLKLFHGLHAAVSQTTIARVMYELMKVPLKAMEKGIANFVNTDPGPMTALINLILCTLFVSVLFGIDLRQANETTGTTDETLIGDGLYQALMTMTTVGYGDMAPNYPWAKALGVLNMPLITGAFNRWKEATDYAKSVRDDSNEAVKKDWTDYKMSAEVCECFGKSYGPASFCEDPPSLEAMKIEDPPKDSSKDAKAKK